MHSGFLNSPTYLAIYQPNWAHLGDGDIDELSRAYGFEFRTPSPSIHFFYGRTNYLPPGAMSESTTSTLSNLYDTSAYVHMYRDRIPPIPRFGTLDPRNVAGRWGIGRSEVREAGVLSYIMVMPYTYLVKRI